MKTPQENEFPSAGRFVDVLQKTLKRGGAEDKKSREPSTPRIKEYTPTMGASCGSSRSLAPMTVAPVQVAPEDMAPAEAAHPSTVLATLAQIIADALVDDYDDDDG